MKKIFLLSLILILMSLTISLNTFTPRPSISELEITIKELYQPLEIEISFFSRYEINDIIQQIPRHDILNFYNQYTNNYIISTEIINQALHHQVPVNIAFAIADIESRFNPNAVNYNHNSIDYGLFQLNDSYRNWSKHEFFNITLNTEEGLRYFKKLLNYFNNDVLKALAAYNAGIYRVENNKIPKSTEQYTKKVLEAEDYYNIEFNAYLKERNLWNIIEIN